MNSAAIQLYHCDVMEGLGALPAGSVDLFVTSPPYNIKTKYGKSRDDMPREQYLHWTSEWVLFMKRALRDSGSVFLNVSGKPSDPWIAHDVAQQFRRHFELQNEIHWVKSIAVNDETYGHFKPINSPRFVNDTHEFIFHFTKQGDVPIDRSAIGAPYKDRSNLNRWKEAKRAGVHCRGNCWFLPYATRQQKLGHPASYPPELAVQCLKLHGLPPAEFAAQFLVVDPFMGIGGTARAAARLGVPCWGFDHHRLYLEAARTYVWEETGEAASLHDGPPGTL